jgi:hypothetical protein
VWWCGEAGGGDGVGEGLVQIGGGDSRWRGEGDVGVVGVEGVEAEQGVEVDESAGLVFGDFGKGQAQRDAVGFTELGQGAVSGNGSASPQFGGPSGNPLKP